MLSYRETSISVLSCCLWWCGLNKPRLITFCCWRVFAFIFFTVLFSANVSVVIAGCISNCVMCIVKVTDVFFGNVSLDFMCWSVATSVIVHCWHSGVFMSYISLHMLLRVVHVNFLRLSSPALGSYTIQHLFINAVSNQLAFFFSLLGDLFYALVCFTNALKCFNYY